MEISKHSLGKKWVILGEPSVNKKKFGDFFEVTNSVATLYNKAFLLKDYQIKDEFYSSGGFLIEQELIRDAASTKSYNKKKCRDKIIFPYRVVDGKKIDYTEEEFMRLFPNASAYLLTYKEKLEKRKSDKNALWFQYGRSQAIARVRGEKLIIPMVITQKVKIYKAPESAVPYAGYFIKQKAGGKLDLENAKMILESKDFYEYVKICGTPTTPNSYRISVDDIKDYMIDI